MAEEPLDISVQGTPNPNATKFTLNRIVAAQGATYRDRAAAEPVWARDMLGIPGVTQVFALQNFISVNKSAEADWSTIIPQVQRVLQGAFAS
jgi:hypothetical protein